MPKRIVKYVSQARQVTLHEREILTILMEECGEVITAASKMIRFGVDDANPKTNILNSRALGLEIGDLSHMIKLVRELALVTEYSVQEGTKRKAERLEIYLQTDREPA